MQQQWIDLEKSIQFDWNKLKTAVTSGKLFSTGERDQQSKRGKSVISKFLSQAAATLTAQVVDKTGSGLRKKIGDVILQKSYFKIDRFITI